MVFLMVFSNYKYQAFTFISPFEAKIKRDDFSSGTDNNKVPTDINTSADNKYATGNESKYTIYDNDATIYV